MKKSFSISPRILSHLGEDLIRNKSIALLELIKNAYDACASECKVTFDFDKRNELTKLIVEDDGFGMDKNVIENAWLTIGTDFKYKNLKPNNCGRIPLGEKGIGRLSVHKIGNKISLISKSKNKKEITLLINWKDLKNASEFNDFKIDFEENDSPTYFTKGTGTYILIEDLKTAWDRREIRDIYRAITSLNSPFDYSNHEFKVTVISNSKIFEDLPTFEEIKRSALYYGKCKLEGSRIVNFKYQFKPWPGLTKVDKGRSKTQNQLLRKELELIDEEQIVIDLDDSKIGPIEFEIIIFEKEGQIFKYADVEKKSFDTYLNQNGGIRVYRDGIRVYDYGEKDNDWLEIDKRRISKVGERVSNNILVGSVKINREESDGLKEKTNREGFIENESYKKFTGAVKYALNLIVKERNVDKQKLATLYKKHKVIEPVLSDLDEVVQIVEKLKPSETKNELLKYLDRVASQYKQVKEILIKSANAGLNLSVVIHELEKLTSELIGFVEKKQFSKALEISVMLEKIVRGYSAMLKRSSIKKNYLSDIVKSALENYEFRFSDHKIDVISNHEKSSLQAYLAEAESISVLTNLLDNSIYWLCYARKANRKISVFITEQLKNFHSIIVSDNGPGFNIPFDVALEPFITGKPHNIGSGLGLHIANEMMREMNGKLILLNKNDIDLPEAAIKNEITQAIIALCFKIDK